MGLPDFFLKQRRTTSVQFCCQNSLRSHFFLYLFEMVEVIGERGMNIRQTQRRYLRNNFVG